MTERSGYSRNLLTISRRAERVNFICVLAVRLEFSDDWSRTDGFWASEFGFCNAPYSPSRYFVQSIKNKYFKSGVRHCPRFKSKSGARLDFALDLCVYSTSAVKGFRLQHARLLE